MTSYSKDTAKIVGLALLTTGLIFGGLYLATKKPYETIKPMIEKSQQDALRAKESALERGN